MLNYTPPICLQCLADAQNKHAHAILEAFRAWARMKGWMF